MPISWNYSYETMTLGHETSHALSYKSYLQFGIRHGPRVHLRGDPEAYSGVKGAIFYINVAHDACLYLGFSPRKTNLFAIKAS